MENSRRINEYINRLQSELGTCIPSGVDGSLVDAEYWLLGNTRWLCQMKLMGYHNPFTEYSPFTLDSGTLVYESVFDKYSEKLESCFIMYAFAKLILYKRFEEFEENTFSI